MSQHLLQLDRRGASHAAQVLRRYLPGLDPGLAPIDDRRALLPDSTMRALRVEYGEQQVAAILRRAGAVDTRAIADVDALERLLQRDTRALPPRPAAPATDPLWHLDGVRVRGAWAHWGGPLAIDWGDVKVGQVDTGYSAHPVLGFPAGTWVDVAAGRTLFAPGAGSGGPGPGGGVDPLQDQMDGHGTRVASVICGHDPAGPGRPYLGVAPKAPLVPVRIADHVFISHAQRELAEALDYLVEEARVSVVNLSMGFLPRWQMGQLDRAIDRAYEAGVILVCAAGQPLSHVVSPAHGRRTIAAAGSTRGGIPWGQSARGSAVDWAAPAAAITRAQAEPGGAGGYAGTGDGTSYAAAITTGAAALWLARHAGRLDAAYPERWQQVEAFKSVAKATAKRMPNQQPGSFGAGILQVDALVNAALPPAASLTQERPA